jgi:hypothetical protein
MQSCVMYERPWPAVAGRWRERPPVPVRLTDAEGKVALLPGFRQPEAAARRLRGGSADCAYSASPKSSSYAVPSYAEKSLLLAARDFRAASRGFTAADAPLAVDALDAALRLCTSRRLSQRVSDSSHPPLDPSDAHTIERRVTPWPSSLRARGTSTRRAGTAPSQAVAARNADASRPKTC